MQIFCPKNVKKTNNRFELQKTTRLSRPKNLVKILHYAL